MKLFRFSFSKATIAVMVILCVLAGIAVTTPALAQSSEAFETFADASSLSQDSIFVIVARVIRVVLSILGILLVCYIIYAGFLYLTARGESDKVEKAQNIFKQTIIGLIIILSSYAITTFILNALIDAAFDGSTSSASEDFSEPLSGSLGGGILDDHYPTRGATEIPRNTLIFVTFKESIDPSSIIDGYAEDSSATGLNTDSVLIYPTDEGQSAALEADEVEVSYDEEFEIWVFDPTDYLGSSESDTNYTVYLTNEILKADGESAFTGSNASGYTWTFEVSTEIDLTPPEVVSVVPTANANEPRNVTIEINFSEAMNPVAVTGSYGDDEFFTNIEVLDSAGDNVEGTFRISNNYRTVDFTTTDACGEDPCGDTIYCLPGDETITVEAKAASINEDDPPQAEVISADFDGLTDAANNSLDGDSDGQACGSSTDAITCDDGDEDDNYEWEFDTTDEIEDTVPHVVSASPDIGDDEVGSTSDVSIIFNTQLKSSTVTTSNASLWPDPYYEFWFGVSKSNNEDDASVINFSHPALVSTEAGGWDYWPVITSDVKSSYQICMYPAIDENGSCSEGRSSSTPYCCNGSPSTTACQTDEQVTTEAEADVDADDYVLPDNSETQE